jgi:glycosidase
MNPRAFTPEGTFAAAAARLPELVALGVDIVWIMPIHPVGVAGRKGPLGSPYAIRDDGAVDPMFGTADDFRRLVDAAHGNGLHLILDAVLNHSAPDHRSLTAHPDRIMRDARGRPTRRVRAWSDVADRNFAAPGLAEELIDTLMRWHDDFGVDGFRCDVAGMVPMEFWRRLRARLLESGRDHFLLAEWDDPELHRHAFPATYDWEWYRAARMVVSGRRSASDLARIFERRFSTFPAGAVPLRFVENHDEPRAPRRFGAAAPALTLMAALSGGAFLLHNGQEIGAIRRPDLFDRDPIDWSIAKAEATRDFVTQLLAWRRRARGMSPPEAIGSGERLPPGLVGFERVKQAAVAGEVPSLSRLVVVANLSGQFREWPDTLRAAVDGKKVAFATTPQTGDVPRGVLPPRSASLYTS